MLKSSNKRPYFFLSLLPGLSLRSCRALRTGCCSSDSDRSNSSRLPQVVNGQQSICLKKSLFRLRRSVLVRLHRSWQINLIYSDLGCDSLEGLLCLNGCR